MVHSYSPGYGNVTLFNTCFLGPTRVHTPNGISISSAIFAQLTASGTYGLQWPPLPPLIIAPFHGGPGPPLNTWFLWPT